MRYSVCAVERREQHLRAVERRDRDEVEDHQDDVDVDEEVEDQDDDLGDRASRLRVDHERERQRDRRDRGQERFESGPGGGDDRLAAVGRPRGSIGLTGVGFAQPNPNAPARR